MTFEFTEQNEKGQQLKVEYSVIQTEEKCGIMGKLQCQDEIEIMVIQKLFFTFEEARCWCSWLAEENVLPSSARDVLRDELYTY